MMGYMNTSYDTAQDTSNAPETPERTRRRWPRRLAIALVALVVLVFAGATTFMVYASDYYHADANATQESLVSMAALPMQQGDDYLAFGDPMAKTGIVLYPGAKVEYSAYAPLMRDLAQRGYLAVVVEMPFNFAFLNINAADGIRAAFPQVESWWVGGHSLGGSMAAQYAAAHANDPALQGIVLLAAYSASDLSDTDLGAIIVYGEHDQVLNRDKLQENASLLPQGALTVQLPGGNHAGFGAYGPQEGDGQATIAPKEQQEQTAELVDSYVRDFSTSSLR